MTNVTVYRDRRKPNNPTLRELQSHIRTPFVAIIVEFGTIRKLSPGQIRGCEVIARDS